MSTLWRSPIPDPRYTPTDVELTQEECARLEGAARSSYIGRELCNEFEAIMAARVAAERERIAQAIEAHDYGAPNRFGAARETRAAAARIARGTA